MTNKSSTIKNQNISAGGNIDILQLVLNSEEGGSNDLSNEIIDRLGQAIAVASSRHADSITKGFTTEPVSPSNAVLEGVYYGHEQQSHAAEAAAQAIWDSASGDDVKIFEMRFHLDKLLDFFARTPEFFVEAKKIGRPLTISELPRAIGLWGDKCESPKERQSIGYLRGVAFYLGCRYGRALELIDPLARETQKPTFHALAAECALNVGQYGVALKHLKDALAYASYDDLQSRLRMALLRSNLGACYEAVLESDTAIREYRLALKLIDPNFDGSLTVLVRALVLNNLGFSLMTLGNESDFESNLQEAETCFRQALDLRESVGDTFANQAVVLFNLAEVRRRLGDMPSAELFLDRASGVLGRLQAPHILGASIDNARGMVHFDCAEYDDALACFRSARKTLTLHFGEKSENCVLTSYSIAQTLEAMGSPKSREYLLHTKSLAIETFDNPSHPVIRMIESDLKPSVFKRVSRFH